MENSNINLRALEPEDLDILYAWENDTSIWHLGNTIAPFSKHVLKQYMENAHRDIYETKQLRLVIQLNDSGRPVGFIDLFDFDPHNHRAGIGILIASPADRRKGYAREALQTLMDYCFTSLNLHQLWCNISAGNEDSIRLFKAAGFEEIGVKKDWTVSGYGYEDELMLQCIPS